MNPEKREDKSIFSCFDMMRVNQFSRMLELAVLETSLELPGVNAIC